MPIDLPKMQQITAGKLLQDGPPSEVHELVYDSRRLVVPERSAFFALRTPARDGADYIAQAYQAGVRVFVVHADFNQQQSWPDAAFLAVDSTLLALQQIARWHRKQRKAGTIAITGSNGKTIVKDWLSWLMQPDYRVCRSPKSYNSQVGVPISVWQLQADDQWGIFEAGISEPGEMARLAAIIEPGTGIFTHLGDAHAEHFSSRAAKLEEKFQLFQKVKRLVLRTDDPDIASAAADLKVRRPHLQLLAWSEHQNTPYRLLGRQATESGMRLQLLSPAGESWLALPFADAASIENAMHCWVLLKELGYADAVLQERFARLPRLQMRLEMKAAVHGSTLINDSYSLDIDSLGIALEQLKGLSQHKQRLLILSDFDLQTTQTEAVYRQLSALLAKYKLHRLYAVGPELHAHSALFAGMEARFYESTSHFLQAMPMDELANAAILLKGARKFGFERIERLLALKMHQTVLEVDLDALLHNFRYFKGLLQPKVKLMVMVKAFSYGSGSVEVASLLQHHRADYLAVAFADEGVALREAGIRLPIMVMNVEPSGIDKLLQYQLEPEVYSFRVLQELQAYLSGAGPSGQLNIHLNIDTGMKRLGFDADDIPRLLPALLNQKQLHVLSVYTHLVASDAPEHRDFSLQQISRFEQAYAQLVEGLGYRPLKHVLNTAGILNYPQAQFDMVRLGIGLYGFDSSGRFQQRLQTVGTLKTIISQIHPLQAGETVGYNRMGKAEQAMQVATLPVGYADGIVRSFGNGKVRFKVGGQLAPTIGNICMDMCMIDVSGIDCREGDPVVIFGEDLPIGAQATAAGTIAYELLTNVSQRVKRVYLKD